MTDVRQTKSDSRCLTKEKDVAPGDTALRANSTLNTYKDLRKKTRQMQVSKTIDRLKKQWGRPNCRLLTSSKEMRQELNVLKEQYTTVCEQESALRSQIALLTAEIVLVDTNEYHRIPINMRKVSVDPISIRKISKIKQQISFERPGFITRHLSNNPQNKSRFDKKKKFPPVDSVLNQAVPRQNRKGKCPSEKKSKSTLNACETQKGTNEFVHENNSIITDVHSLHYCPYCSFSAIQPMFSIPVC
ncbi:unnamed protein product [Mytilus coruscus]|uniref:Uncharacterized protein n=1 Tax=Mytilus coruscus TaxID=42192 RepID=A0A6J8C4M4_MYTCO|nr:unnamed protein product [Mytilus coruscus]